MSRERYGMHRRSSTSEPRGHGWRICLKMRPVAVNKIKANVLSVKFKCSCHCYLYSLSQLLGRPNTLPPNSSSAGKEGKLIVFPQMNSNVPPGTAFPCHRPLCPLASHPLEAVTEWKDADLQPCRDDANNQKLLSSPTSFSFADGV